MEAEHICSHNIGQHLKKVHSKQVTEKWGYITPSRKAMPRLCFKGCGVIQHVDNWWREQPYMEQCLQRCNRSSSMAFLMGYENFEQDFKAVDGEVIRHKEEFMG